MPTGPSQFEEFSRLDRLEWVAKGIVEGFLTGRHRSPYRGFSVEYLDHRPYVPGDAIRAIDWKVFARTDKYQIKLFQDETNLQATLLLDCSESMNFPVGEPRTKWHYATYLAAALSYLLLSQHDAVGAVVFDEEVRQEIPPRARSDQFRHLIHLFESVPGHAKTRIPEVLHELAERRTRRGLVVLVSDLLTDSERVLEAFRHLRHARQEVVVIHLLDPAELEFPYRQRAEFRDPESNSRLVAYPPALKREYQGRLNDWFERLESGCREEDVLYHRATTRDSFYDLLSTVIDRRFRIG